MKQCEVSELTNALTTPDPGITGLQLLAGEIRAGCDNVACSITAVAEALQRVEDALEENA